jgi:N-acetylneuraminic acid mutarotase
MPLQLAEVAQFIIGDNMYVIGTGSRATLAYNFTSKTWYAPGAYAERPFYGDHHAVEVFGGKAYVIGGLLGSGGKVQILDPVANTWTSGSSAPWDGGSISTALIGDKIYAAGGVIGSTPSDYQGTGSTTQAAVYDIATDTWTPIAPMPFPRHHTAATTDGQKFYLFGGREGKNKLANGFADVLVYDPATNAWASNLTTASLKPMPIGRSGLGKAVYNAGMFYVFGGET